MKEARSLAEVVRSRAQCDPDGELVRLAGAPGWSAGRLHDRAVCLARGLARVVSPGDAVLTAVQPGPETIALTTALSTLGAVEVACAESLGRDAVRRVARITNSVLAVVDPARLAAEPGLAELAALSTTGLVLTNQAVESRAGITLDDLAATPGVLPAHDPSPGGPALAVPTSGTDGRAKVAVLPNGAALGQARRVQRAMEYSKDDVVLNFFSWQHINARHASFLPVAMAGARLVVDRRFSATQFWERAAAEQVTTFNFMGAVCAMLLRRPPGPLDAAHRVTRAYGGPAPDWLVDQMAMRFGVQLRQAYACTELGDVSTTASEVRPGAAGRPVPEYDLEVRDESGRRLPNGASGELVVRPREEHLTFTHYAGDPEATRAAWREGWFHTGDRGRIDDGWLWIEGRGTDVIRRRGLNISAASVEDAVAAFPGVAEVAAVAVPSELTEDEVLVVVVPSGPELDPADLHRHCQAALPRHAVPRYVSVEQSLPRNQNHKVLRSRLRERGLPASAWDAETFVAPTAQDPS